MTPPVDPAAGGELPDPALLEIGQFVQQRSAIVLPPGKQYLLRSRLASILRDRDLPDAAALAAELRLGRDKELIADVLEALTTNETSWFRDVHPFHAIERTVLPELIAARENTTRTLRIWSAACSTGQELYSIAMLLDDAFPELESWNVELVGTDLSHSVVDQAAAGRYSSLEINRGLPASYMARYFFRDGSHFVITDRLRERTSFRQMNFMDPWPYLGNFDLVLCRNVLIYFDVAARAKVLAGIRSVLAPDGFLMLGSSETQVAEGESFDKQVLARTTVYRPRLP